MILDMFDDLKSLVGSKLSSEVPPKINSAIFVSMRVAAILTALSCIMVTSRNYIGDNINCYVASAGKEELKAIESYCFISSTFTLTNFTLTAPTRGAHPGVGPQPSRVFDPHALAQEGIEGEDEEETIRHAYYQWVPFLLALQSIMLYLPCMLWDAKEDGYLLQLLNGTHAVYVDQGEAKKKAEKSAALFNFSMNHTNRPFMIWFMVYEMVAVAIALGNMFLTNQFLGGRFFSFGASALRYLSSSAYESHNPLNVVFPKVGKCTWHSFGKSGTIVTKDSLCVLPLNIVNEKVYIVLYLAYIAVAVAVCLALVYHIVVISVPTMLEFVMRRRMKTAEGARNLVTVLEKSSRGDAFMLWCLQSYTLNFEGWLLTVNNDARQK